MCAETKTVKPLVVQQHANLNTKLYQYTHKHLQQAERTRKLP